MRAVTISDIADRMGISKQSVGFALGNYPNSRTRLGFETRRRILETARRLGYVPHHAGRRLARARSSSRATSFDQVGLILLPGADGAVDTVCLMMMQGAEPELYQFHASLTFVRVASDEDWEKVNRLSRAGGVDGWLVYGAVTDQAVRPLTASKIPFVILGDHRCTQPVHSVNIDNFAVGQMAAEHLAALGHRRIAYLDSRLELVYQRQIHAGFRAAVKKLGLDEDARLISITSSLWSKPGGALVVEWLRDVGATALFAPEPNWAVELWRVLDRYQIEVPNEISLLGCEPAWSSAKSQNFTRLELPMAGVGGQGARLLHRVVTQPGTAVSELKISPLLIEGWSTVAPSSRNTRTTN